MFLKILVCILGCIILLKLFTILTKGTFKTNISLNGKTALVTGGNAGMGYEIALFLASRGCRVIIADISNAVKTADDIGKTTGNPHVVYQHLDLSRLTSVRKLAAILLFTEARLDIVVNNAGCGGYKCRTEDDIYKVLQVNYLGHFLLTHLLAPLLIKTKNSRVVFVSSLLAFTNNLNSNKSINSIVDWSFPIISEIFDYGNSKACILAASAIFAQIFSKHGVTVTVCHPGLVKTQIFTTFFANLHTNGNVFQNIVKFIVYLVVIVFGKSPLDGIQSAVYCALSENIKSGDFIVDDRFFKPLNLYNTKLSAHIWEESIRLAEIQCNELLK